MSEVHTKDDEELAKKLQLQFDKEYDEEEKEDKFPQGIGPYAIQFLDDLWNNRNIKVIDDLFAPDCVSKGAFGDTVGTAEFKEKVVGPLFAAFPDLKYVSHEVYQEGSRIVNRWTFTGTHSGADYHGIKAQGKKFTYSGVTINAFNNEGELSEISTFFDRLSLFEQLTGTKLFSQ